MPRRDFFTEIRSTHISPACRRGHHEDCDGIVYPKERNGNQHDCGCSHHMTTEERERRREAARRARAINQKKRRG